MDDRRFFDAVTYRVMPHVEIIRNTCGVPERTRDMTALIQDAFHGIQFSVGLNDQGNDGCLNVSEYKGNEAIPCYDYGDREYDAKCKRIQEAGDVPWEYDKLLWIGRPVSPGRARMIELHGGRIDAFDSNLHEHISHVHHCKYRYLIDIEGGDDVQNLVGFSARLMYLVHTRRLLFIAERSFYDWTLNRMQPWVHYVPVARDLSDLHEKIEWADGHTAEVKQMIDAMTESAPTRQDALNAIRLKLYSIHI